MKLHHRTMRVQSASAEIRLRLLDYEADLGLTDVEMLHILTEAQQAYVRSILRAERHPDDPTRKADEE